MMGGASAAVGENNVGDDDEAMETLALNDPLLPLPPLGPRRLHLPPQPPLLRRRRLRPRRQRPTALAGITVEAGLRLRAIHPDLGLRPAEGGGVGAELARPRWQHLRDLPRHHPHRLPRLLRRGGRAGDLGVHGAAVVPGRRHPRRPARGVVPGVLLAVAAGQERGGGAVMQKLEFVEQRRAALERYLARLAAHPVVGRSHELRVFLTASGRLPLPMMTDVASRMLDGAVKLPKQLFAGESAVVGVHEVEF